MNKLMIFPLSVMLILTMISFVYSPADIWTGNSPNVDPGTITINGSSQTVDVPGSDPQAFDIFSAGGVLLIIIAVIAIGIVSGITALGSGLSDNAQNIIVNSVLWLGLWACLTVITGGFLFGTGIIFTIIYLAVTFMFIIGLGFHITDSGSADA